MNIGKSIKELRQEQLISQEDFAASVGVTHNELRAIEKGHEKPTLELLQQMADILNKPIFMLFWSAIELEDVPKGKHQGYEALKLTIDDLISVVF